MRLLNGRKRRSLVVRLKFQGPVQTTGLGSTAKNSIRGRASIRICVMMEGKERTANIASFYDPPGVATAGMYKPPGFLYRRATRSAGELEIILVTSESNKYWSRIVG